MASAITRHLFCTMLLLLVLSISPATLFAEEVKQTTSQSVQNIPELDQMLAKVERQNEHIKEFQDRALENEGQVKALFEVRVDKARIKLLEKGMLFAEEVLKKSESNPAANSYRQPATEILSAQFRTAETVIRRILSRATLPKSDLSAADQAAAYAILFRIADVLNHTYELLYQNIVLSKKFGMDITEQESLFKKALIDRSTTASFMLDATTNIVVTLRASLAAVPEDAELKAKLNVAENNIDGIANILSGILDLMESLEMDTASYREQLLSVTGEITSEAFEIGVITKLLTNWWQSLLALVSEHGPDILVKILLFCLIVYISRKIANTVQRLVERGLDKSKLQLSELLRRMIITMIRSAVMILGVLIGLSQVGISIGPLFAGLGVAGFIVGFALQDSLSNFASGVMILVYRPFDVGDLIETAGVRGKVSHMSIVNTTILTLDNQTIILPNNKIWGDVIRNVTAQHSRRIDMVFGISYTDDIPKAERVMEDILNSNSKVLKNPEPIVRLNELGDSSVNFVVRPWVKMDDYLDVYWEVTRAVKMRFDEEGISIPFPQRDVHFYPQRPQES